MAMCRERVLAALQLAIEDRSLCPRRRTACLSAAQHIEAVCQSINHVQLALLLVLG